MVKKIISVHIPRTAGGTFGRGVLSQIHFQVPGWYTELVKSKKTENELIDGIVPTAEFNINAPATHGHFPYKPEYKKHFLVTIVRDPVNHVISRWRYHRSNTPDQCSLIDFTVKGVKNRLFTNVQTKFFNEGTVNDFNMVGITEQFDRSVDLFFKKIGLENRIDPVTYKTQSSSPGLFRNASTFIYEPLDEEIEIIREHSKLDMDLYEKALYKFEKDCAEFGI